MTSPLRAPVQDRNGIEWRKGRDYVRQAVLDLLSRPETDLVAAADVAVPDVAVSRWKLEESSIAGLVRSSKAHGAPGSLDSRELPGSRRSRPPEDRSGDGVLLSPIQFYHGSATWNRSLSSSTGNAGKAGGTSPRDGRFVGSQSTIPF